MVCIVNADLTCIKCRQVKEVLEKIRNIDGAN